MKKQPETGRSNQRRRTRRELLTAAARLLKEKRKLTLDDVAATAMVSRATAYRYFPSIEALLVEAPLELDMPTADGVFAGDDSTDPIARVDKAEAAMHEMCYRNETSLRRMLAASLERGAKGLPADEIPVRQNRRAELIKAALAPARGQFSDAAYRKLTAALALLFGPESMIVFRDVLGVDEKTARRTKHWAISALVRAALEE